MTSPIESYKTASSDELDLDRTELSGITAADEPDEELEDDEEDDEDEDEDEDAEDEDGEEDEEEADDEEE